MIREWNRFESSLLIKADKSKLFCERWHITHCSMPHDNVQIGFILYTDDDILDVNFLGTHSFNMKDNALLLSLPSPAMNMKQSEAVAHTEIQKRAN